MGYKNTKFPCESGLQSTRSFEKGRALRSSPGLAHTVGLTPFTSGRRDLNNSGLGLIVVGRATDARL